MFEAWAARGGQTVRPKTFFTATLGTPLSMQDLRKQAIPDGQRQHAPAAATLHDATSEYDSEQSGGGAAADFDRDEPGYAQDDESIIAPGGPGPRIGRGRATVVVGGAASASCYSAAAADAAGGGGGGGDSCGAAAGEAAERGGNGEQIIIF